MIENQDFELMKSQLEALKKELGKQKITNRRMINRIISAKTIFLNVSDIVGLVVLGIVTFWIVYIGPRNGFPWWIIAVIVSMAIVGLVYTVVMRRKDRAYQPEGTLAEYSLRMCKARKRMKKELLITSPVGLAFVGFVMYYGIKQLGCSIHWIIRVLSVEACVLVVGIVVIICQAHALDTIIRQIQDLQEDDSFSSNDQ